MIKIVNAINISDGNRFLKNKLVFTTQKIIEASKLTTGWSQCINYHDNKNTLNLTMSGDAERGWGVPIQIIEALKLTIRWIQCTNYHDTKIKLNLTWGGGGNRRRMGWCNQLKLWGFGSTLMGICRGLIFSLTRTLPPPPHRLPLPPRQFLLVI